MHGLDLGPLDRRVPAQVADAAPVRVDGPRPVVGRPGGCRPSAAPAATASAPAASDAAATPSETATAAAAASPTPRPTATPVRPRGVARPSARRSRGVRSSETRIGCHAGTAGAPAERRRSASSAAASMSRAIRSTSKPPGAPAPSLERLVGRAERAEVGRGRRRRVAVRVEREGAAAERAAHLVGRGRRRDAEDLVRGGGGHRGGSGIGRRRTRPVPPAGGIVAHPNGSLPAPPDASAGPRSSAAGGGTPAGGSNLPLPRAASGALPVVHEHVVGREVRRVHLREVRVGLVPLRRLAEAAARSRSTWRCRTRPSRSGGG